jgi:uncharacterized protein YjiS (DUF1127 family)
MLTSVDNPLEPNMNAQPPFLSRSLIERVVSGVDKAFRAAGALPALWRDNRARTREMRAFAAIADMNEHMLRDIGAHDRLVAHAAARRDVDYRRRIAVQLSTPLLMVTLMATATLGAAGQAADSRPTRRAPAQAELLGDFTGEYVDGTPIYRLPPVIVVASRKVERARLAREEQSTRAQQARAKAAARNPA